MKKLPDRVERKKEIWKKYKDELDGIAGVKLFSHNLKNTSPWFIDSLVEDRSDLIKYLRDYQIGTRVMYPPINKQTAYNLSDYHPVSEMVGKKGLWLPSYVQLSDDEILYITSKIIDFYR